LSPLRLETVEVEPAAPADASVVLLHGLGADGHDFESVVPGMDLPGVRWVFPHAPVRRVTINGGHPMRAWYDIVGLDRRAPEDAEGIAGSADGVRALVEREGQRGVPPGRVVLAGFSQGGALALHVALRHPERLGGVVALSTYLPLPGSLAREAHPANAAVAIFMAHGRYDPIVPPALGEGSRDALRERGYDVEWHSYPMPHSVCAEELADLRAWLRLVVPPRS
jgi:phospholipase/carboxylesterase